jgi:deoxycytidylate deaminase
MARDARFLNLALKIAGQSQHKFPIGAVITIGNRILSIGTNKYKTHPKQINNYINNHSNSTDKHGTSIHAELAAILSYPKLKGSTIYVARLLHNGAFGLSKPCLSCQNLIEIAGIKKIVYNDGEEIKTIIVGENND